MKCRVCKRTLKNPEAIRLGIGPVCARKTGSPFPKSIAQTDGDTDTIVPYDGGNVWIERVPATTLFEGRTGTQQMPSIHECSGIKTNVPRQIYKHSPTGYNFGYGGSGPADFALNVLLMFAKFSDDAYRLYQQFKREFVAGSQDKILNIERKEIENFLVFNGASIKNPN